MLHTHRHRYMIFCKCNNDKIFCFYLCYTNCHIRLASLPSLCLMDSAPTNMQYQKIEKAPSLPLLLLQYCKAFYLVCNFLYNHYIFGNTRVACF